MLTQSPILEAAGAFSASSSSKEVGVDTRSAFTRIGITHREAVLYENGRGMNGIFHQVFVDPHLRGHAQGKKLKEPRSSRRIQYDNCQSWIGTAQEFGRVLRFECVV